MTRQLACFIACMAVLTFVTGCPPVEPESTKTANAETSIVEAQQSQIHKAELPEVKTPEVQTSISEPPKPETNEPEIPKPETPRPEIFSATAQKPKATPADSFHNKCADILKKFVDETGMVDYKTLKRNKSELKKLLDEFDELDREIYNSWPKKDKIAFWINAYNIQLLKIIIDNYPIQSSRILRILWPPNSIRHIKGIWDRYKFIVMDEEFTLLEIEKRFFRGQFDEPKVFFAISHASLSSPPLRNEPYYGSRLNEQLDDQVKKFLSSPIGLSIDREDHIVYLSAVLQPGWFGGEFVDKYGIDKKFKDQQPAVRAVLNFITNYIPEEDTSFLEVQYYSIEYLNYDWRLNEQ